MVITLDVDLGETLKLLSTLQWVCDLQLTNVDFEMGANVLVLSIYGHTLDVSDFRQLLMVVRACCLLI
jgi:hypothetical protein